MTTSASPYRGFRFPTEVIEHAVWLSHCFSLSLRDVELILAARGVVVSYETSRDWGLRFGRLFANALKRRRPRPGDKTACLLWRGEVVRLAVCTARGLHRVGPGLLMHRRRTIGDVTTFIGLDVHKATVSVGLAEAGRAGEVRFLGEIPNWPPAIARFIQKLAQRRLGQLSFCYEAGPCGYALYWQLRQAGQFCRPSNFQLGLVLFEVTAHNAPGCRKLDWLNRRQDSREESKCACISTNN